MEKQIKIEWCENFIKAFFRKHECGGVYTKLLFDEAAKRGLYVPETYGSPFSQALENVCEVYTINDKETGDFIYAAFRLKAGAEPRRTDQEGR